MITQRTNGLHGLLIIAQTGAALCLYSVLIVCFFQLRGAVDLSRYVLYAAVVAAALVIEALQRDKGLIRTSVFERSMVKLHAPAFRQTFAVFVALLATVTLTKDATLSRIFLFAYLGTLYPLLLFTSARIPQWLAQTIFRGARENNTVLVGSTAKVPRLNQWLERKQAFGFRTIGLLCDEKTPPVIHGLPVLGSSDDLERIFREQQVSQVIVLGLPLVLHAHSHLITVCNRYGARLMILSDLEERLHHPAIHIDDDGLQFITLRQEPLENPLNRGIKRLLDVAMALPVVFLLLPILTALVWILQRIQSPGPLFYRQIRSGLQNNEFEIIKFRTMHPDGDDPERQATVGDPRVFRAGRWLRRLSLDELPQFLNVLRGDMSVVGPRPHLVEHNRKFAEQLANYHIRAFIRPGITGLAQVRGLRGEATAPEAIADRVTADTLYLENWSLFLDLGIIGQTALQMLTPPSSAY